MRFITEWVRRTVICCLMAALLSAVPVHPAFAEEKTIDLSPEATAANVSKVEALASALCSANNASTPCGGFSWDTERKSRSWTYYNGIMMDAFLMLDSAAYTDYVEGFCNANIGTRRIIRNNQDCGYVDNSSSSDNYYRRDELDSIPPARVLFDLIRSGSPNQDKYIRMIEYIYTLMQEPSWIVPDAGGNFLHKRNNSNWAAYQVALDGLYMAQPFFMELANAKEEGLLNSSDILRNIDSGGIYSDVYNRLVWAGSALYDENTGLYNHGWGPGAGVNGHFWLRAIGWYAAALADVISMMPDAAYRNSLIEVEKTLFDGMIARQDASGMWYNVVNRDASLSDGSGNRLESSGSALMAYAMMRLYAEGYVDETYGLAGLRAFNGTVGEKMASGNLTDVYRSSGVSISDAGYLTSTYETNEAKGVGPLIMAASFANAAAQRLKAAVRDPEYTPPAARPDLVYDGTSQELVTAGETGHGTIEYVLEKVERSEETDASDPSDSSDPADENNAVDETNAEDEDDETGGENADDKMTGEDAADKAAGTDEPDGTDEPAGTDEPEIAGGTEVAPGTERTAPEEGWTEEIPTGMDAGTYFVWYRLTGDVLHNDVAPRFISVVIAPKEITVKASDQAVTLFERIDTDVSRATLDGALEGHILHAVTLTAGSTAAVTTGGTITPSAAEIYNDAEDVTDNYQITYVSGNLTVLQPEYGIIILPAGLREVEEEAFAGSGITEVIVPESLERIAGHAFTGCMSLKRVTVLGTDTAIEEEAFDNCPELVLYCRADSSAEQFAESHSIPYVIIE